MSEYIFLKTNYSRHDILDIHIKCQGKTSQAYYVYLPKSWHSHPLEKMVVPIDCEMYYKRGIVRLLGTLVYAEVRDDEWHVEPYER